MDSILQKSQSLIIDLQLNGDDITSRIRRPVLREQSRLVKLPILEKFGRSGTLINNWTYFRVQKWQTRLKVKNKHNKSVKMCQKKKKRDCTGPTVRWKFMCSDSVGCIIVAWHNAYTAFSNWFSRTSTDLHFLLLVVHMCEELNLKNTKTPYYSQLSEHTNFHRTERRSWCLPFISNKTRLKESLLRCSYQTAQNWENISRRSANTIPNHASILLISKTKPRAITEECGKINVIPLPPKDTVVHPLFWIKRVKSYSRRGTTFWKFEKSKNRKFWPKCGWRDYLLGIPSFLTHKIFRQTQQQSAKIRWISLEFHSSIFSANCIGHTIPA